MGRCHLATAHAMRESSTLKANSRETAFSTIQMESPAILAAGRPMRSMDSESSTTKILRLIVNDKRPIGTSIGKQWGGPIMRGSSRWTRRKASGPYT